MNLEELAQEDIDMVQEHIEQSWHNEAFLEHIKGTTPADFNDWKVTVCFYVALHLVRAFLAKKGHNSSSHYDTLNCINPTPLEKPTCPTPIKGLYQVYNRMYLNSRDSRYTGFLHVKGFEAMQVLKFAETTACLERVKDELRNQKLKLDRKPITTPKPEEPK